MKHIYKLIHALLFAIFVIAPLKGLAQESDTLIVEWRNPDQTVRFNGLYETIQADTNVNGERYPNRVYKLRQGGYYYVQERIQNNGWHLHIVGEKGDPTDPNKFPPFIQLLTRDDGSRTNKILQAAGDVTLKNLTITGRVSNGDLPYEIIRFDGNDSKIVIDNVIWERSQWGMFSSYGQNTSIYVTNSTFRNLVSEFQQWGGRGFSVWANIDTMIVENNTFVNIGAYPVQLANSTQNFFVFNHNTVVGTGRHLVLGAQLKNAYITNNLVLNPFWQGEDVAAGEVDAERLASTDRQFSGMISITTLPTDVGIDASRRLAFANNNFFTQPIFNNWFAAEDSINKQPLLNVEAQNLFDEVSGMVAVNNTLDVHDPGFTTYPDNQATQIEFITDVRNGDSDVTLHYWDPGRDETNNFSVMWPLPGDYTYSNTTLKTAAIGGYPLGDLNWYPEQKALWEANKNAQYAAIEELMGAEIESTYLTKLETSQASTGGNAEVTSPPDRLIAFIGPAGNIVWYDVQMAAGTYDVQVALRTPSASTNVNRATHLVINDGGNNTFPIGEAQDGITWTEVTIPGISFQDGANKVALNRAWGFLEYRDIKIKEAGTENVVMTLWPGESTLEGGGEYRCGAGNICSNGDDIIDTKDGGTATFTYEAEGNGTILAVLSYFLADGDADVTVSLNGEEVTTETLTATGDSVLTTMNFSNLAFKQGSNELVFNATSGGLWIDELDLYLLGEFMTVSNEWNDEAENFRLSQNYPNPFNPTTNINFTLPFASNVQLSVFNILGQKVATLVDETRVAGNYTVNFDARSLASGVYFYMLQAGDFTLQRKMTLIK
ncbi:MAG: T9SS type A sorting domain-containing protein [Balneola sp.]